MVDRKYARLADECKGTPKSEAAASVVKQRDSSDAEDVHPVHSDTFPASSARAPAHD